MATNGIVLIKPSTVDKTGASSTATINTGGSVTFDLCETLSLNGVFSSTYDNYIIDVRWQQATSDQRLDIRMRASGSDNSTANSYVAQRLRAFSTTVDAGRITATAAEFSNSGDNERNGVTAYIYGPNLAQPTAGRTVTADSEGAAYIRDYAWTHNQSTAYDGFTLITSSSTFTGLIKVYGLVK